MQTLARLTFASLSLCVLGLIFSVQQAASAQNLITNGSFETGNLSGWTSSGNVEARNDEGATDGIYSAVYNYADSAPGGSLSQTIATTPGEFYQLQFDYGTFGSGPAQKLVPVINGRGFPATSAAASQPTNFTRFAFSFQATETTTTISLGEDANNNTAGADGVLDNVVVFALDLIISEFRLSGPGGANDKFIEFHNRGGNNIDISRFHLFLLRNDGSVSGPQIPAGTIIPARSHFLFALPAYSLGAYASPDIPDPVDRSTYLSGVGLFTETLPDPSTRIDSVRFSDAPESNGFFVRGFSEGTPLPQTGDTNAEHSWVRKLNSGISQDTDDNLNDFVLVSTNAAPLGGVQSTLGAPAPENSQSPVQRNAAIKASSIDTCSGAGVCQNRRRIGTPVPNGAYGTLKFRRKFTNTTNAAVTQLRFRVVDITTLNSPGYAPGNGQADLRVVPSDSSSFSVTLSTGESVPMSGTQVETTPAQPLGGGLNSGIVLITPVTVAAGDSINVEFNLGVQQEGNFRFFVNVEALPAPVVTAASPSTLKASATKAARAGKR